MLGCGEHGAGCTLTLVSWLNSPSQPLGWLLASWVTLDKCLLFRCPRFTLSRGDQISSSAGAAGTMQGLAARLGEDWKS